MTNESPQKPPKSALDTVANIAIIIACVALVAMVARNMFFQPKPAPPPGAAAKGDTLKALQAVLPSGEERVLVAAIAPGCHFCDESFPFYKTLIEQRNQKGSKVKFVTAVSGEAQKEPEATKLTGAGITPDQMVAVDFNSIKVPGTPTLMLVDGKGKILDVWVGKLDPSGEKEVLARL
jgi:thioredoxin-related protein